MTKQQMIEQGIYDLPMGEKGVSRVSAADVALATPNALETMVSAGAGNRSTSAD